MKLLKVFNQNYLKVLKILQKSFCDPNVTSDKLLSEECERIAKLINVLKDKDTPTEIQTNFNNDIQPYKNDIFQRKSYVFEQDLLNFLAKFKFSEIWNRLEDSEKDVFWQNISGLCKYNSMLRACGKEISSMENMALDFMEDKKHLQPEECHQALFKEMLSGGEMSQKLLNTFQNGASIKNILENVGDLLKTSTGNNVGNDLSDILNMASQVDEAELDETVSEMKNTDMTNLQIC